MSNTADIDYLESIGAINWGVDPAVNPSVVEDWRLSIKIAIG